MVKLTKIYTRTGDQGQTQLAGGHPIPKSSDHIAAIGDIDELNAWIGLCIEITNTDDKPSAASQLPIIQHQLFNLGCELAVIAEDRRSDTPALQAQDITALENQIDAMNTQLPPLQSFILPGGSKAVAELHICRTVCRRTERQLVKLNEKHALNPLVIQYINRLSDWLFVFARTWAQHTNTHETYWDPLYNNDAN